MEVLLLHGWAANSRQQWFPYIRRELGKKKVKVYAPNLPRPKIPDLTDWSWVITKNLLKMGSRRIVICHSLGGVALLRTLEEVKLPIDLVIFVSVPLHVHTKREFLSKFFKIRYRWNIIRKSIKKAIIIHAKDDPWVSYINGQEIARQLRGKLIMPKSGKHFTTKKFPLLLNLLSSALS